MQKLALAMRYDSIMTSMRHGKADDSMVQKAIEIAKKIGRDVNVDLKDPNYEEVD